VPIGWLSSGTDDYQKHATVHTKLTYSFSVSGRGGFEGQSWGAGPKARRAPLTLIGE
jgi:hypothetical protein